MMPHNHKPVIQMHPVKSSSVSHVGYDASTRVLGITFKNGATYHYADVPTSKYHALMKAESIGSYVHLNLLNKHTHKKI